MLKTFSARQVTADVLSHLERRRPAIVSDDEAIRSEIRAALVPVRREYGELDLPARYLDALERRDPQTRNSEDYVMVARCSLMLRGLGSMLNQHRSAAAAWAPIARKVLREEAGEEV
jgi:hypothetical protein